MRGFPVAIRAIVRALAAPGARCARGPMCPMCFMCVMTKYRSVRNHPLGPPAKTMNWGQVKCAWNTGGAK